MRSGSDLLPAVVLLAAGIFVIDLELPLGVASGVPYVAVVLLALWSPDPRMPLYVAVGCSILTALGFAFSPHGGVLWVVILNRALAIFAIWVTAILSVRWRSAQRRMSQQQERLERVSRVNTMGEMPRRRSWRSRREGWSRPICCRISKRSRTRPNVAVRSSVVFATSSRIEKWSVRHTT
ncbi:MAG: hypothetical protein JRG90_12440 [Deltaproteobacteria bacterium]|nr:hypothetical protein [Deltaproteobacteria bacterium]